MNFINDYDFFTLPTREPPDELLPSAMRYKIPLKMADRSSPVRVVFSEFSLSGFGCTWTFPKLTLVFNPEEPIEGRLATPELQSPADSSLNPDRPIRFAWSDVEGVEEYGIWCSVGDTTVTIYTGQSPFLTIAQWYWENMPDATYFWWVTAKGGTGQSEQSEIWTFTKRSENDANVPEQLSPEDGIINPDTPFTLSWAESPGVPTYTIRFTMPGSDDFMYFDTDGTELVVDQALWDGLPEGALFWQVKPATGYGAASFCGRRSFIKRPVDCTNDIDMISIPAGTFQMGSPEDEFGRDAPEGPMHTVNISAFEMSSTPITRKQWRDTMGWLEGGDDPWETDNHPVDSVTWYDAAAFCNKLSEIEGLTKCYTMSDVRYDQPQHHIGYAEVSCDWSANGYRLATEAEWEYACRAGTTTRYYSGDSVFDLDCVGWYMCNSGLRMQPVAAKEPNAFGLYDMHGQDWEWCWDWLSYNYYSESPTQDPRGPDTGDYGEFKKIHRGGARQRRAWNCRSAKRYSHSPATRGSYIIFRIARSGG
ncbi:MAG: formylglycine-generating enzyme family protein [Candidatus Coatesbacteria bacterium]|nr:formylglycine-generating enzyme family protein [Candidatus Coatesbacteria bacterium]